MVGVIDTVDLIYASVCREKYCTNTKSTIYYNSLHLQVIILIRETNVYIKIRIKPLIIMFFLLMINLSHYLCTRFVEWTQLIKQAGSKLDTFSQRCPIMRTFRSNSIILWAFSDQQSRTSTSDIDLFHPINTNIIHVHT